METTSFGRWGGKGDNLKGVQLPWAHPRYGPVIQVPGESIIRGGWWLAGGDPESEEGLGILEENEKNPEQGGVEAAGPHILRQIRRPVSVALWYGNVGGYPLHGMGHGEFPRLGGAVTDRAAATLEVER